ncbi:MAG: crossover junction endodeoxyribonuclease RuvC [Chitinophagaceae bacterium]
MSTHIEERIILGIDPGSIIMGYALISTYPTFRLIDMGVIKLGSEKNIYIRLKIIFEEIITILNKYKPTEAAIELPFYGKNVQSMLKLGRAQGVAIAAVAHYGISITEYSPRKVKLAATGSGNASKEKLSSMLKQIFNLQTIPKHFDATDALGIALCHYQNVGLINLKKENKHIVKKKSLSPKNNMWKTFILHNEDKIVK